MLKATSETFRYLEQSTVKLEDGGTEMKESKAIEILEVELGTKCGKTGQD